MAGDAMVMLSGKERVSVRMMPVERPFERVGVDVLPDVTVFGFAAYDAVVE